MEKVNKLIAECQTFPDSTIAEQPRAKQRNLTEYYILYTSTPQNNKHKNKQVKQNENLTMLGVPFLPSVINKKGPGLCPFGPGLSKK